MSSAAEKLKALEAAATPTPWATNHPSPRHVTNWIGRERFFHLCRSDEDAALVALVRNALPQLVAVVEAAEAVEWQHHEPWSNEYKGIVAALAALDAALTVDGKPPK